MELEAFDFASKDDMPSFFVTEPVSASPRDMSVPSITDSAGNPREVWIRRALSFTT